jgi:outer membrane protein TolC
MAALLLPMMTSCARRSGKLHLSHGQAVAPVMQVAALEIEEPMPACVEPSGDLLHTPPPPDPDDPPESWELTLEEAVHLALANSRVFRDAGGMVLREPSQSQTVYDPAIQEADPRFGVHAALADFDASFSAGVFFENNDRPLNNLFEGGGTRRFQQDRHLYQMELAKRTAVGTELFARNVTDYDFNNAPGNNTPNLPWDQVLEVGFRQPLLQGAGTQFNRIAGRQGIPGFYNGVVIARLRTDVSLAEFESAVQELVSQVENGYWELYFAYRDLDAKRSARDRAHEVWQQVHALYLTGQRGGEAEQEWQAREQFFRFEADVQEALLGRYTEVAATNSLPGRGGIYAAERRLRLVIGLPASDGRLIRPVDEPSMARVLFDWEAALVESLQRRVELRRQKWTIVTREMELLAAKNFLLPRLDAVGGYRFRGLGADLLSTERDPGERFDSAFRNLTTGDFQEWELGLDFTVPIGNRRAGAAVRHAELLLARERAILREQEQQVVNQLSGVIVEARRAHQLAQTNYNRQLAAREQLAALEAVYQDADQSEKLRLLDLLLDAQRRLAEAESNLHRSQAEYAVAVKNVHLAKGSLLDYSEIVLAERGPSF